MNNSRVKSKNQRQCKKSSSILSIRLNDDEHARLIELAGTMPLSTYIKSVVFKGDRVTSKPGRKSRNPVKDHKMLAEVLACLGRNRLNERLSEVAISVQNSAFYDDRIEADIKQACADIHAIRVMLMRALGFQNRDIVKINESASQSFTRTSVNRRAWS
ncbi:MAG: hypothetical protein AAF228_08390 [Pseudomonadota bacterium]